MVGMSVLKTDGANNHDPKAWAEKTAEHLIEIDKANAKSTNGRRLLADIIDILVAAHSDIQTHEKSELDKEGLARINAGFEVPGATDVVDQIMVAGRKYQEFADNFTDGYKEYVTKVVVKHLAASMNVERSLVADKHPDSEETKAYRARRDGLVESASPGKKKKKDK